MLWSEHTPTILLHCRCNYYWLYLFCYIIEFSEFYMVIDKVKLANSNTTKQFKSLMFNSDLLFCRNTKSTNIEENLLTVGTVTADYPVCNILQILKSYILLLNLKEHFLAGNYPPSILNRAIKKEIQTQWNIY